MHLRPKGSEVKMSHFAPHSVINSFIHYTPPQHQKKKKGGGAAERIILGEDRNLNIDCVWAGSGFEKVISSPANGFFSILKLAFHEAAKLNDTPGEHGGGKHHWKPKLNIDPDIIIATHQFNLQQNCPSKVKK